MAETTVIVANGVEYKVTRIGLEDTGGVDVLGALFINQQQVFPSNGGVNPIELTVNQGSHAFVVGEPIFLALGGDYESCVADDETAVDCDGVVSQVIDANNFIVQNTGRFQLAIADIPLEPGSPALDPNGSETLYVSALQEGTVTTVKPSLPNFVKGVYKTMGDGTVLLKLESLYVQGAP